MKARGAWLVRLAMAGSCLAWAGCGGGDVPDPDSDSAAAVDAPSKPANRAAEAPEAPADAPAKPEALAKAEPAGPDGPAKPQPPATAGNPPRPDAPPAPAATDPPAEGDKAPPGVKGDASGTDDLLRMAGSPATPPAAGAAPAPAPAAPATPPAPPATNPAPPPSSGPSIPPPAATGSFSSGNPNGNGTPPSGASGGGNRPPSGGMAREEGGLPAGGPGFGGGMPLGGTPGGGAGADAGPAAFRQPMTAVAAFLAALQSKDKNRLAQATAIRSATEAEEKRRKVFASIVDQSISDDELADMAKTLEGYQVVTQLPAKSTGRIGVVIGRATNRDTLQRTVTVRKEREGWKVMDIAEALDFQPNRAAPGARGGRRR